MEEDPHHPPRVSNKYNITKKLQNDLKSLTKTELHLKLSQKRQIDNAMCRLHLILEI